MREPAGSGRWVRRGNTVTLFGVGGTGEAIARELALEQETASRPLLRRGSTGAAVRDLQVRLQSLGFDPGPADGIFGGGTQAAVVSFQRSRGLTPDGIVGPQTWSALLSTPPSGGGTQGPATPTAPGFGGKLTLERILAAMTRKGHVIATEPYRLNIVGVRHDLPEPNRFDDFITVFFKDSGGSWTFKSYPATTDPGMYWLHNPTYVTGTAILAPGQYRDSHQLGLHRNTYTALVQRGPLTVIRDADKDDLLDFTGGDRITGYFGINIHRASATGTTSVVDRYSAGCQVFASATDFARFLELCQRHSQLHGNKFTYTLLDEGDL
ncbi:MAG TPA: peptidoglycan-binding domain-containing protein [Kofleriaceae bacterium]|nr:peptidoglycan-binding domain-containing protein [Kofleriaceae bacterium]